MRQYLSTGGQGALNGSRMSAINGRKSADAREVDHIRTTGSRGKAKDRVVFGSPAARQTRLGIRYRSINERIRLEPPDEVVAATTAGYRVGTLSSGDRIETTGAGDCVATVQSEGNVSGVGTQRNRVCSVIADDNSNRRRDELVSGLVCDGNGKGINSACTRAGYIGAACGKRAAARQAKKSRVRAAQRITERITAVRVASRDEGSDQLVGIQAATARSEERRVGKECR